jgi:hypothetical protein
MKAEDKRVCQVCGTPFPAASDFCPVCVLRGAVGDDQATSELVADRLFIVRAPVWTLRGSRARPTMPPILHWKTACVGRATQSGRRSVQAKSRVAPDCEPCAVLRQYWPRQFADRTADRPDGSACCRLSGSDAGGSSVNAHAPRGSHTLSRCRSMVCIALPILRSPRTQSSVTAEDWQLALESGSSLGAGAADSLGSAHLGKPTAIGI